jgi:glycerate kinase
LSSEKAAEHIGNGIRKAMKDAELIYCPVADGGEGTTRALVRATDGKIIFREASDPLMRRIDSFYGVSGDGETAIIEVAAASGLELLKRDERDPFITSSFGTGELIKDALESGYRKFIIGLGGSAVNDCGAGIIAALGVKITDGAGKVVFPCGGELNKAANIDLSSIDRRIYESVFLVACDVTNPLTAEKGASKVFAPQKGADSFKAEVLDRNLSHFSHLLKEATGREADQVEGAGAAGGIGAIMITVFNAKMMRGFDIVSQAADLEKKVKDADLIITAEGRVDKQTLSGKAPVGICRLGKKYGKPVWIFCGRKGEGAEELLSYGAQEIIQIAEEGASIEESIRNAGTLLEKAVYEIINSK